MEDRQPRQPPQPGDRGFGRDEDLEKRRLKDRPAEADLDATEEKAGRRPVIDVSPDPDE